jgi:DNA recombination protein RmuC
MAPFLLFITGVLAGLIAGFILSRLFQRGSTGDGAGERRLLEERLLKADQGLEHFSRQLEIQSAELKGIQQDALQAREAAAISRTELEAVTRERDALHRTHLANHELVEQTRAEREALSTCLAETSEKPDPVPGAGSHRSVNPVPLTQWPDAGWLSRSAAEKYQGNGE